jgi:hypothetical protein
VRVFHYWLFSDQLIYGEPTGLGYYNVNRVILLVEMRISPAETHVVHAEKAFLIESPAKSFITITK